MNLPTKSLFFHYFWCLKKENFLNGELLNYFTHFSFGQSSSRFLFPASHISTSKTVSSKVQPIFFINRPSSFKLQTLINVVWLFKEALETFFFTILFKCIENCTANAISVVNPKIFEMQIRRRIKFEQLWEKGGRTMEGSILDVASEWKKILSDSGRDLGFNSAFI